MLLYDFVEIALPFELAEEGLLRHLEAIQGTADRAYRDGESFAVRVGLAVPVAKTVELRLGAPVRRLDQTTIPLTWRATGAPALFPFMEADLLLTPLGADYTYLAFRGSYHPPLGIVGQAMDRVLHRLAEVTVRRFTERLAASLADAAQRAPTA